MPSGAKPDDYTKDREVSAHKNIDFVINDPLFIMIPVDQQEHIKSMQGIKESIDWEADDALMRRDVIHIIDHAQASGNKWLMHAMCGVTATVAHYHDNDCMTNDHWKSTCKTCNALLQKRQSRAVR